VNFEEEFLSRILALLASTNPEDDNEFLSKLRSITDGKRDHPTVILIDPVRPSSLERVKKVRAIIRRKFNLETTNASSATAALYGFHSYRQLQDAHFAPGGASGLSLEDEECPAATIIKRRMVQATVLVKLTSSDATVAKRVIQLVRPTARDWTPSLIALTPFRRPRVQHRNIETK
jgi:hypothetical protein